ncbi:MAG: hypothetical protein ACOX6T_15575, partial [Myxococcales bacterium]
NNPSKPAATPVEPLNPVEPEDFEPDFGVFNTEEARRLGGVTDMFRKAMVAGLGAVFMTEEGIRTMVKDLKLPKDVVGYVVGQAERSKDELFRVIGEELRGLFQSAALRRELVKLLSNMTIEVKAEIRVRPDGEAPEVKVDAAARRRGKKRS